MIKKFKIFDNYNFDDEIDETKRILSNFKPVVEKYEEDGDYFSVLIKDQNSNFKTWLDITFNNGEYESEWNQISYNNRNSNDIVKQNIQNSEGILDTCSNIAIDKLLVDEKIYDDEEDGYVIYKNYWYIKDGFKESGIDYETAKRIRYDYNL